MAKLSRKVTNNSNNSQEKNKPSFSLTTKTEKKDTENIISPEKDKNTVQQTNLIEIPQDVDSLKKLILEKLNLYDKIFISKQELNDIVGKEEKFSDKELNKTIIDKIFEDTVVERIKDILTGINTKSENLHSQIQELNSKLQKQDILIKNITAQVEDAEELAYKTAKKYSDAVPLRDILKIYISENIKNEQTDKIENLLEDSYTNGGKNGQRFTLKFIKAFIWIDNAIMNLSEDEKENIEILNRAGKNFLSEISGTNSTERRPLLDIIAQLFNLYIKEYDFISPEQTLQIDPSIHNAEGLGGTMIKEGLSFALVRKDTRKTVFYADIVSA